MEAETIKTHIAEWSKRLTADIKIVNLDAVQNMAIEISTNKAWRNRFALVEAGQAEPGKTWEAFETRVFSSAWVEGYIKLTDERQNGPG